MLKHILIITLLIFCNSAFAKTIEFKNINIIVDIPNKYEYFTYNHFPQQVSHDLNLTKSQAHELLKSTNSLLDCYDINTMTEMLFKHTKNKTTIQIGDALNFTQKDLREFEKSCIKSLEKEHQVIIEKTDIVDTSNARYFKFSGFKNFNGRIVTVIIYTTIKNGALLGFTGTSYDGKTSNLEKLLTHAVNNIKFSIKQTSVSSNTTKPSAYATTPTAYSSNSTAPQKPSTTYRAITKGIGSALSYLLFAGLFYLGNLLWNKFKKPKN